MLTQSWCLWQADQTIQQIINDNEYQQGASRGTVNAMAADTTQNWTLTFLNGDVSYARSALSQTTCCCTLTATKLVDFNNYLLQHQYKSQVSDFTYLLQHH